MSFMKIGVLIVASGFFSNLFFGGSTEKTDVAALIQKGALVVDVRTANEFSDGHIEGAINIPYEQIATEIGSYEMDKDRPIVVYCLSGSRSRAARRYLTKAGYTRVVNGGSLRKMRKLLNQ